MELKHATQTFVVFTRETGGNFQVWPASRETYEQAIQTGELDISSTRSGKDVVRPKYLVFAEETSNYDFVLERSR